MTPASHRLHFEGFPNVQRWVGTSRSSPSWKKVNEVMYGFAGSLKDQKFESV